MLGGLVEAFLLHEFIGVDGTVHAGGAGADDDGIVGVYVDSMAVNGVCVHAFIPYGVG